LSNVIKEAKRIYHDKKIQKSNNKCKPTWDIIKKQTNNHHSHTDIQELMIDIKQLHDHQDIADAFNNHFSSIIDNIRNNNVNRQNNSAKFPQKFIEQKYINPPPPLVIKTFSTMEIFSIIKELKTNNSHGFDEISTELLKISVTHICSPLT